MPCCEPPSASDHRCGRPVAARRWRRWRGRRWWCDRWQRVGTTSRIGGGGGGDGSGGGGGRRRRRRRGGTCSSNSSGRRSFTAATAVTAAAAFPAAAFPAAGGARLRLAARGCVRRGCRRRSSRSGWWQRWRCTSGDRADLGRRDRDLGGRALGGGEARDLGGRARGLDGRARARSALGRRGGGGGGGGGDGGARGGGGDGGGDGGVEGGVGAGARDAPDGAGRALDRAGRGLRGSTPSPPRSPLAAPGVGDGDLAALLVGIAAPIDDLDAEIGRLRARCASTARQWRGCVRNSRLRDARRATPAARGRRRRRRVFGPRRTRRRWPTPPRGRSDHRHAQREIDGASAQREQLEQDLDAAKSAAVEQADAVRRHADALQEASLTRRQEGVAAASTLQEIVEALTALCDSVLPTPSQPTPSKPTPSQPGSRFPGGFGSTATAAAATRPEGVRGASGNELEAAARRRRAAREGLAGGGASRLRLGALEAGEVLGSSRRHDAELLRHELRAAETEYFECRGALSAADGALRGLEAELRSQRALVDETRRQAAASMSRCVCESAVPIEALRSSLAEAEEHAAEKARTADELQAELRAQYVESMGRSRAHSGNSRLRRAAGRLGSYETAHRREHQQAQQRASSSATRSSRAVNATRASPPPPPSAGTASRSASCSPSRWTARRLGDLAHSSATPGADRAPLRPSWTTSTRRWPMAALQLSDDARPSSRRALRASRDTRCAPLHSRATG